MPQITSFRELDVYRMAGREARSIFTLTKRFPREEQYSLTDQIRRSSWAIGAMIAEAWGKRRCELAFISKLVDALGEAVEVQAWLDHALACEYISKAEYRERDAVCQQIGGKLNKMIDRAESFCRSASAR